MTPNDKERPVVSGLEEIFDIPDTSNVDTPSDGASEVNEQAGAQRKEGSRRSRRRPRRRRKNNADREASEAPAVESTFDDASDESEYGASSDFSDEIEADEVDEDASVDDDEISYTEITLSTESPEMVEVVGVRFKETSKTYYFSPEGESFKIGEHIIVETARGMEYGIISVANTFVPVSAIVPPLRTVIRRATDEDEIRHTENLSKAKEAFGICLEKIRDHGLDMKLIEAEYAFDQSKLTFYFSADGRVDFRELVKDLAGVFRTRIELRQIGIRDEAKLVGGLGVCGRPFCCSTFLSDFVQVSIKMAKEQNLSLNSAKISGACGRLMCCLRYEHDTYAEEIKKTPSVGSRVKTADGVGVVVETSPLRGKIKVRLGDEQNQTIREFDRDDVSVLAKKSNEDRASE